MAALLVGSIRFIGTGMLAALAIALLTPGRCAAPSFRARYSSVALACVGLLYWVIAGLMEGCCGADPYKTPPIAGFYLEAF